MNIQLPTILPSNSDLIDYSNNIERNEIEEARRKFCDFINLEKNKHGDFNLEDIETEVGQPIKSYTDFKDRSTANIFYVEKNGYRYILGAYINGSIRRQLPDQPFAKFIQPYNLNPAVHYKNIADTEDPNLELRHLGAELELGIISPDGSSPSSKKIKTFIKKYKQFAKNNNISSQVDSEACEDQMEIHITPIKGYKNIYTYFKNMFHSLVISSKETELLISILSTFPTQSDFPISHDPKVEVAKKTFRITNNMSPLHQQRLDKVYERYHIPLRDIPDKQLKIFRIQGLHVHLDIAGRSEALALFGFHTLLRSATAIANAALLKGGPFVNGVYDPDFLCTREYLRQTTVTGSMLELPTSPHFGSDNMEVYAKLLYSDFTNTPGRALLAVAIDKNGNQVLDIQQEGHLISAMHNPIGRIRPDMPNKNRVCTLESMCMPSNPSALRNAFVLADLQLSMLLVEDYFREHGTDIDAMQSDRNLLSVLGTLPQSHL